MANDISIVYSLKDNFTNTLRGISNNQQKFKETLDNTSKQLAALYDKKRQLQIDNKAADKAIKDTMKNAEKFGADYDEIMKKNAKTKLQIQLQTEEVNNRIKETQSKMSTLNKTKAKPEVSIKDSASNQLDGIKSKLNSINRLAQAAAGIFVGGKLAEGLSTTFQYGSDLEKQMVSIQHFMQVNNKNKSTVQVQNMAHDYLMQVRKNADVTPFETNDVVAAGTRALTVAGGNSKQGMDYLKLAENMAALNPQKTLDDAMEALATLKMGQTRRMQEFGFHITQADLKKAGGNLANIKNANGISIQDMFKGGATELSTTGSGLASTIKSKFKTQMADAGYQMLEALRPAMEKVIPLLDALSPRMTAIGNSMGKGITTAIDYGERLYDWFQGKMPTIRTIVSDVSQWIGDRFGWVGSKADFLSRVMGVSWNGIWEALSTAWDIMKPIFDLLAVSAKIIFDAFEWAFPAIEDVIKTSWAIIKPILELFADMITGITDGLKYITNYNGYRAQSDAQAKINIQQKRQEQLDNGIGPNMRTRAIGIPRVPYDNYPVLLHEGETVLTKQESNSTRKGSFHIAKLADNIVIREEADIDKVATALANKLLNTSFNMS